MNNFSLDTEKTSSVWWHCSIQRLHRDFRVVFKETVSRDSYFFEVPNISPSTFCVCADGFQFLSNVFHHLYNYKLFFFFFKMTDLFWKCLPKSSSKFPSLWLVDVLAGQPLIGWRENAPNSVATGGFRYDFAGSFMYAFSGTKSPL